MTQITRRKLLTTTLAAGSVALLSGALKAEAASTAAAPVAQSSASQLVIGIGVDPVSLDPRATQVTEALSLTHVIDEEFLFRDNNGNPIPQLVDSWEYTSPTTLTLHLKPGLQFENGEPIDAQAFKYTVDTVRDPANTWIAAEKRGWFEPITSVTAADPATAVFEMSAPNHVVLSYLTMIGVVPPVAAANAGAAYGNTPIATGPYSLVQYTPGDSLDLRARSDYWGTPAQTSKVTVRFIPEDATRLAALEAGEVHVIENIPPDQVARISANDNLEVLSVPSVRTVFAAFMPDRPPFNDARLRQAVMYAIDRQSLVDDVLGGYGQVAQSMYAPGVRFFQAQPPYAYDPDKAKSLIQDAGLSTSTPLKFAYPTGRTINDRAIGQAVAGMLQKVGLQLQQDTPEWGTFLDNYQQRRIYDFVLASMAPDNLDPDYALFPWFRSDTSFLKYSDPGVDDLLHRGAAASDDTTQASIYSQLQSYLWNQLPYAPLYVVPQLWAKAKNVSGFDLRPDSFWLFANAAVG